MDEQTAEAIVTDFKEWSGGIPPDSEQEIFIYVEFARPEATNAAEVTKVLSDWMEREWNNDQWPANPSNYKPVARPEV
jgi:hypothetical protein